MKALVLAGGTGTRLRPLTYTIAKQLVPVANKPVLYYVMQHLKDAGVKQVGVIISPETGSQIREALLANSWGFEFTFLVQDKPAGLAHAVVTARDFLREEPFVMYLGDNLVGQGIREFVRLFDQSRADAVVLLKEVPNPRLFGVAQIDSAGRILKLIEKPKNPPSNLALVGVYVFSPKIHDAIKKIRPSHRGELEITDAIQQLLESGGSVHGLVLQSWWLDCGKKDDLLEANRVVLDELSLGNIKGQVDEISRVSGRVSVGQNSCVRGSTIRGPAVVGEGSIIEESFIGPYTSIGSQCKIKQSEIEHAVVFDGAKIMGVSRLEDSVVGRNSIVEKQTAGHSALRLLIGDDAQVFL